MNHDIDRLVERIAPVTDARAAELLTDDTAADLARRITGAPTVARTGDIAVRPRPRDRRGLGTGLSLLATGAAVTVAVTLVTRLGGAEVPPTRPGNGQVSLVAALGFIRKGDYLDVRIRDPYADPERYKREFAEHGLNLSLNMVPASPSIVGTLVTWDLSDGTTEDDLKPIRVKGACDVASGGDDCTVGVRIRIGYKGTGIIVFARAARHGEKYESTANATARGEAMHGMTFRRRHVSEVLAALKKRNVTVPEYRVTVGNETEARYPGQVPANWYVHGAVPWAQNQVILFTGPNPDRD
ncbi:hypothetical protein [Actinomadura roseirufa]|uniref:hypothetical protein n=1 Tax=Actinomadura roseirufa TaxID=2094049 RepID=UPI0010410083|nr:hypothetical protein [Actinomadura roseirufa]